MESEQSQRLFVDRLVSAAADMAFYGKTSYAQALTLTASQISDFYACTAFKNQKKVKEYNQSVIAGVMSRLDNQIKAIGILSKIIAQKPSM